MRDFIQTIAKLFFKIKPIDKKSYGEAKNTTLRSIFNALTGYPKMINNVNHLTNPNIHISDAKYQLPTKDQIENFLWSDDTSWREYALEHSDCDDFAFILAGRLRENFPGFATGIVLSSNHAFNLFIDNNYQVWIIEPQSNKIFKPGEQINLDYNLRVVFI